MSGGINDKKICAVSCIFFWVPNHSKRWTADKMQDDGELYKALKILNQNENPIKDRKTWWNNNTLCMHSAELGHVLEVKDDDKNETWNSTFWTKWNAMFEQWYHVARDT